MSYQVFRNRMNAKGGTSHDRRMNRAKRSFQNWFDNALSKELVTIDGIEQFAVLHDQNQNNNKDLSDDKYIMVENSSNMLVGSYVKWRGKTWIVFTDEHKTIPTHKQAKVKESNHVIKWMVGGKICGNGHGYNAFIQNQTLYTLGVSTSGSHAWLANAKMMMYLPNNPESKSIQIGQRIVIGGAVYQIMFKDYVSREGLIHYLLEQDMTSTDRDNLELGVADYYTEFVDETPLEHPVIDKEVSIVGADKAKIGSLIKYEAEVFENGLKIQDGVTEWTIVDTEGVATVVDQTEKSVSIRIVNNFQKVGSVINIIGKTSDGVIGSKRVNITSPY